MEENRAPARQYNNRPTDNRQVGDNDRPSRPSYSNNRPGGFNNRRKGPRKKVCRFCENKMTIDYKDSRMLKSFITERGKILPARVTGNCNRHQRELASAIKTARTIALIPYGINPNNHHSSRG